MPPSKTNNGEHAAMEARLTNIEGWMSNLDGKMDSHLTDHSSIQRITRLEERQNHLQRIVYGAIGILVTLEIAGVIYVLERI